MRVRRMKVLFKRAVLGNVAALLLCGSVILLYFCLLRYNTANTHFDIRSHEVKKRFSRGDPLQIKVPWKKLLQANIYREKGGNWTRRLGPSSPLSVFVVEEHHEVIPYWFDAANAKALSRHGNTLIHIDGHSDMALPVYFPDFPTYRWPKTKQDFKLMMQRNDVFIAEAVITGLLKRVVWIWPIWDKVNHNASYEISKSQLGLTKVTNKNNEVHDMFCICAQYTQSKISDCVYFDFEDDLKSKEIPKYKCAIKKNFIFEEVREDLASKYLLDSKWLPIQDEVILDVDEDYFGCVYASQPLYDVGMKEAEINHINNYLEKLVCPKSLAQEKYADNVFVTALEMFRKTLLCLSSKQPKNIKKCQTMAKTSVQVTNYLQNVLWQNKKIHLCSKQHHAVKYAMSELLHSFQKLNSKQVKAMQRIGFCLNTSPKTYKVTFPSIFQLCIGNNKPSDSAVTVHKPTKKSITDRTSTLHTIFQSLKTKSVRLVTICRSSRDGYTPRKYGKQIEDNIMKGLNKSFHNCVPHYDNGLLGGVNGWPNRAGVGVKHG